MKIDEEQQVQDLFNSNQAQDPSTFDLTAKKFVFKLITESQKDTNKSKVPINHIWSKYFTMEDDQQKNPTTKKSYFQSKQELKRALEAMEADEICIIAGDDVILMN